MTDLFIEDIPYEEIIGHLNELTGKKFRVTTPLYIERIQNQWKQGNRLNDFKYVNTVKAEEWLGTHMESNLNPDNLYGQFFDKYRNQRYRKPQSEQQPEPPEPEQTAEEKRESGYSSRYLGILNKRRTYNWDAEEYERLKKEWSQAQ